MAQAQQMQAEMARAQESLSETRVTGSAGGGLVSAQMSGDGTLQTVIIDPSVVDPADVETLGDLVVAAVRDAQRQVGELSSRAYGAATGGIQDALSGLGLSTPGTIDADEIDADDDAIDRD